MGHAICQVTLVLHIVWAGGGDPGRDQDARHFCWHACQHMENSATYVRDASCMPVITSKFVIKPFVLGYLWAHLEFALHSSVLLQAFGCHPVLVCSPSNTMLH